MKICTKCKIVQDELFFSKNSYWCKMCCKQYRLDNKEYLKERRQIYLSSNKEHIKQAKHIYYTDNADSIIGKQIYNNSLRKEEIKEYQKIYQKKYKKIRKKNDPVYKLRSYISVSINAALKKVGCSKHGGSCLKYLPFSINDLFLHLEKQFEPWMSWNNHGKYNSDTWDDNDLSTWTWQIDHIVPHSTFNYCSMNDSEFIKCWELNNLRPLSSKQNLLDGVNKTRHK